MDDARAPLRVSCGIDAALLVAIDRPRKPSTAIATPIICSDRAGGYSRVLRCGFRSGDRAPMAIIEYVARPGEIRRARAGTARKATTNTTSVATQVLREPSRPELAAAAAALARGKQQDLR